MATLDHTPRGRGYRESLIYFHHDKQVAAFHFRARTASYSLLLPSLSQRLLVVCFPAQVQRDLRHRPVAHGGKQREPPAGACPRLQQHLRRHESRGEFRAG